MKSTHSTSRAEARGMLRVDTERRFLPRFKNRGLAPSNVSISVHGIDKEMEKLIRERAKTEGRSVNKVVKELIADALGIGGKKKKKDRRQEFADLCGVWTKEEAEQFLESIADMETIDDEDWK